MRQRPAKGDNNVWYHYDDHSDTAFVFVHGILSDSRSCWYYEDRDDESKSCYWPELVLEDPRLDKPSIFLGGYYTAIDSGPYEIRNCASELYRAIRRDDDDPELRPPVMEKERIVFICHSTGGIVARYFQQHPSYSAADVRQLLQLDAAEQGTAPLHSPTASYTFDGIQEGVAQAP